MLPHGTRGLGLAQYVLKPLDLFGSMCELETRLTAGASHLNSVMLDLELFKFDAYVCELGVEVVVVVYLVGEAPIIVKKEVVVQELEVSGGAHHEITEPRRDRECGLCFGFFVILVVGFHV